MSIHYVSVIMQLSDSDTLLYTCPANTEARVIKATAINTGAAETIDINKVPSGDAVDPANLVEDGRTISPTGDIPDQLIGLLGAVLTAGYKIYGVAGTAAQITIDLGIVESV